MIAKKSGKVFAAAGITIAVLSVGACSKPADPAALGADKTSAAAVACNRECLIDATDAYVAAMVAHDPAKAPLSHDIVFVENVTKMKPGEGLWKSIVKGPSTFAIHVPDEINQTAGYLAMMTSMAPPQAPQGASPEQRAEFAEKPPVEQPVIVAIRLKFDPEGRIVQAEHLVSGVREAQRVNLQSPRPGIFTEIPGGAAQVPRRADRDRRDLLRRARRQRRRRCPVRRRLRAPRERHDHRRAGGPGDRARARSPVRRPRPRPTAHDCVGQLVEQDHDPYIDTIDNRRVFAADPVTGPDDGAVALPPIRWPVRPTK